MPLTSRCWWLTAALLAASGCAPDQPWFGDAQSRRGPRPSPGDDVVRVVCFYQQPLWLNLDRERDANPEGFKFNMYLVSRKTNKGVLADGVLHTRMYCREKRPGQPTRRHEVCAWTQALADVVRTNRAFQLGWAYQPHFYWADADVLGKEVEIVSWYEPLDGRKIYAQTKTLKVPAPR